MNATCPACGTDLDFEPWKGDSASDEICPCCGIQFGYDDAAGGDPLRRPTIYRQWRERWLASGAQWFSVSRPPPPSWDVQSQIERVRDH